MPHCCAKTLQGRIKQLITLIDTRVHTNHRDQIEPKKEYYQDLTQCTKSYEQSQLDVQQTRKTVKINSCNAQSSEILASRTFPPLSYSKETLQFPQKQKNQNFFFWL